MITILSVIFGGIIGSFANMLIYRLPRQLDIVFKRSHCPQCSHILSVINLIPILSFLFQKGRCSYCSINIPKRYFLTEFLCIFICLYSIDLIVINPFTGVHFLLMSYLLVILFFTDLETQLLPLPLTLLLILLGIVYACIQKTLFASFVLGCCVFCVFLLFRWVTMLFYKKETLGLGDGFLLAGISINFNGMLTLSTVYIGIILAGIYSLILITFTSKTRHSYIPFGPFLVSGFFISYFFNPIQYFL